MTAIRRPFGAALLVASGIVAALAVGQLPAFGRTDHGTSAVPGAAPQQVVCAGPAIAVGAAGEKATALTATGSPTRVAGTTAGTKPKVTSLKRGSVSGGGAAPRALTAPAAQPSAGLLAAAQLETVTTGDVAGLAASACSQPSNDVWFAAGATATGRTTVLTLANAATIEAVAEVRVWTENGPVDDGREREVVVPARSRVALSLAGLVQNAGGTVVRVSTTGGLVAAALEQRTVRGLESGGVDLTGPTAAPATVQTLTGLRISGAANTASASTADGYADLAPVVRVFIPGSEAAEVSISVVGSNGQTAQLGRRVAARTVTDFSLPGLADGEYGVTVSADVPLVVGARSSVVADAGASVTPDTTAPPTTDSGAPAGSDAGLVGGDGPVDTGDGGGESPSGPTSTARGIDLAWFAAGGVLGARAAVAVLDGPAPQLTLTNPTKGAATVTLGGATTATVEVPAGGTVTTDVTPGVLALSGCEGLSGAVSYAGTAAVAGYPVTSGDQAARPVVVTH